MDVELHYREQGTGEPLILLHGNGEDGSYFEHQMNAFASRFRVIALDTRGRSNHPTRFSALFVISIHKRKTSRPQSFERQQSYEADAERNASRSGFFDTAACANPNPHVTPSKRSRIRSVRPLRPRTPRITMGAVPLRREIGEPVYYSSGNYEAFARPAKPEGIEDKSAYIVGTGLAGLSAACYLIRDAQMDGSRVHLFERDAEPGGACDGWEYPQLGFTMRGGREMDNHFEVMWDLFRSIPSIEDENMSILDY